MTHVLCWMQLLEEEERKVAYLSKTVYVLDCSVPAECFPELPDTARHWVSCTVQIISQARSAWYVSDAWSIINQMIYEGGIWIQICYLEWRIMCSKQIQIRIWMRCSIWWGVQQKRHEWEVFIFMWVSDQIWGLSMWSSQEKERPHPGRWKWSMYLHQCIYSNEFTEFIHP